MKNNKGFTLVELLAVIVILAIILAIAIPGIGGIINTAKKGAFESDVKMIIKGIELKELESTVDTTVTAPTEGNITAGDYGADATNYTLLCITDMDPITVCASTTSNSKFGTQVATTITKSSVSTDPVCTCQ